MSFEALASALGAPLLHVSEPSRPRGARPFGAGKLGARGRRRLGRELARATARLERSPVWRRSLHELAELASAFAADLDGAQKARWLELEEQLLEHSRRLNVAFFTHGFRRGARWGEALAKARTRAATGETEAPHADAEAALVALAELVAKLARR